MLIMYLSFAVPENLTFLYFTYNPIMSLSSVFYHHTEEREFYHFEEENKQLFF
jgi:hypothetical protein